MTDDKSAPLEQLELESIAFEVFIEDEFYASATGSAAFAEAYRYALQAQELGGSARIEMVHRKVVTLIGGPEVARAIVDRPPPKPRREDEGVCQHTWEEVCGMALGGGLTGYRVPRGLVCRRCLTFIPSKQE